jgi:ABC-type transport system involved in multi-copper enzyme maturation permease subunit
MLHDPVAAKELRGSSRRWQTYVGRCLFVGITAYLLYEFWKSAWAGTPGGRGMVSVSQYAQLAREIFIRVEWVALALTVIGAVIAGSDMIAREARGGTLGLLFLTFLTPRGVVLGKWKGAMLIALGLYLCGLPVQAIAVYLGGVGPADLARSVVYTLGFASVAAAVSLYFSARLKSGGAAVAASIPLLLLLLVAYGTVDAIGAVGFRAMAGSQVVVHHGGVCTAVFAVLTVALYLHFAVRQLRRRIRAEQDSSEVARELRALRLEDVRDQRPPRSRRILTTWRAVWEGNPLLWKEFTLRPALRVREDWRARAYVILFSFLMASWVFSGFAGGNAFFGLWGTFFTIVALAAGCLLFAPEKEGRQWLMLLSTPVTALQVVRAKLLCGLIFPEAAGLIVLYLFTLAAWLGMQTIYTFLTAAAVCTLFLLFAYALAAAASLRARTARSAFLFAGGIVAFLLTVPPLLSGAAGSLRTDSGWNELWCWVEALCPLNVLEAFEIGERSHWEMPPLAVERTLRFFALYVPMTLLLPVEMVLRFRRVAIRA